MRCLIEVNHDTTLPHYGKGIVLFYSIMSIIVMGM